MNMKKIAAAAFTIILNTCFSAQTNPVAIKAEIAKELREVKRSIDNVISDTKKRFLQDRVQKPFYPHRSRGGIDAGVSQMVPYNDLTKAEIDAVPFMGLSADSSSVEWKRGEKNVIPKITILIGRIDTALSGSPAQQFIYRDITLDSEGRIAAISRAYIMSGDKWPDMRFPESFLKKRLDHAKEQKCENVQKYQEFCKPTNSWLRSRRTPAPGK